MSRSDPQFNLRIPEALRDKVMAAAKENKRSATAEILARLEESFAPPSVRPDAPLIIKSKKDGTLSSSKTSVTATPEQLFLVINELSDRLTDMEIQLIEIKKASQE